MYGPIDWAQLAPLLAALQGQGQLEGMPSAADMPAMPTAPSPAAPATPAPQPSWPGMAPYTGSATAAAGMPAGQPRDVKRYGFGGEHAWFGGFGGQPYGLASIIAGQQAGQPRQTAAPSFDSLVELMRRGNTAPDIAGGA
ncbi:MAG TPA: hypothetical protein VD995_04625 [Azospirillum sp.]|nr:hypothetical protein [Azospirillum sp.]